MVAILSWPQFVKRDRNCTQHVRSIPSRANGLATLSDKPFSSTVMSAIYVYIWMVSKHVTRRALFMVLCTKLYLIVQLNSVGLPREMSAIAQALFLFPHVWLFLMPICIGKLIVFSRLCATCWLADVPWKKRSYYLGVNMRKYKKLYHIYSNS